MSREDQNINSIKGFTDFAKGKGADTTNLEKEYEKLAKQVGIIFDGKNISNFNGQLESSNKIIRILDGLFGDLGGTVRKVVGASQVGRFIAASIDATTSFRESIYDLSREHVDALEHQQKFNQAINQTAADFGLSNDEATKMVSTLTDLSYGFGTGKKSMDEMTDAVARGSVNLGISTTETAKMLDKWDVTYRMAPKLGNQVALAFRNIAAESRATVSDIIKFSESMDSMMLKFTGSKGAQVRAESAAAMAALKDIGISQPEMFSKMLTDITGGNVALTNIAGNVIGNVQDMLKSSAGSSEVLQKIINNIVQSAHDTLGFSGELTTDVDKRLTIMKESGRMQYKFLTDDTNFVREILANYDKLPAAAKKELEASKQKNDMSLQMSNSFDRMNKAWSAVKNNFMTSVGIPLLNVASKFLVVILDLMNKIIKTYNFFATIGSFGTAKKMQEIPSIPDLTYDNNGNAITPGTAPTQATVPQKEMSGREAYIKASKEAEATQAAQNTGGDTGVIGYGVSLGVVGASGVVAYKIAKAAKNAAVYTKNILKIGASIAKSLEAGKTIEETLASINESLGKTASAVSKLAIEAGEVGSKSPGITKEVVETSKVISKFSEYFPSFAKASQKIAGIGKGMVGGGKEVLGLAKADVGELAGSAIKLGGTEIGGTLGKIGSKAIPYIAIAEVAINAVTHGVQGYGEGIAGEGVKLTGMQFKNPIDLISEYIFYELGKAKKAKMDENIFGAERYKDTIKGSDANVKALRQLQITDKDRFNVEMDRLRKLQTSDKDLFEKEMANFQIGQKFVQAKIDARNKEMAGEDALKAAAAKKIQMDQIKDDMNAMVAGKAKEDAYYKHNRPYAMGGEPVADVQNLTVDMTPEKFRQLPSARMAGESSANTGMSLAIHETLQDIHKTLKNGNQSADRERSRPTSLISPILQRANAPA